MKNLSLLLSVGLLLQFIAAITAQSPSPSVNPNANIIRTLMTTSTQQERVQILDARDFVFDFTGNVGVLTDRGGKTVAANAGTFPALIGNGIAMTLGYLGPCGLNLPHVHPRASEFNYIASGSFDAGFFMENGNTVKMFNLSQGMAAIFPQGSIHFEQNLNCQPAVFVAAFNHEDPGLSTVASSFFGLPAQILGAALGGLNISTIEQLASVLPGQPGLGVEECRRRCGLVLDKR